MVICGRWFNVQLSLSFLGASECRLGSGWLLQRMSACLPFSRGFRARSGEDRKRNVYKYIDFGARQVTLSEEPLTAFACSVSSRHTHHDIPASHRRLSNRFDPGALLLRCIASTYNSNTTISQACICFPFLLRTLFSFHALFVSVILIGGTG